MKKNVVISMGVLFLMVLVLAQGVAYSQDDIIEPMPVGGSHAGVDPVQDEDGLWFMPTGGQQTELVNSQGTANTGGPDDFGYTWTDNVGLSWVSAAAGIDTGLGSGNYPDYTGAIDIGFPFKFYENTYQKLYISRYGFMSFDDTNLWNGQSRIPSPEPPNDVIAPHWVLADGANYIHYLRGGTAPNRYFVVEWNGLYDDCCDEEEEKDVYTFETIIYESGKILFQYGQMKPDGGRWCESSGIEDMTGLDGLEITGFCQQVDSNHAVQITRPAPSARVRMTPSYGGSFAHAGQMETFEIVVRNTGEFGADTYDLFPSSSAWTTSLYKADGVTPLTDTDGDTVIDTGSINPASQVTIVAKVQTPTTVAVGDYSTFNVVARSSLNTGVSKTAQIRTAVPTRFGLISMDDADNLIDLSLYQPAGRTQIQLSPENHYGSDLAVTNTPDDGFLSMWTRGRTNNQGIYVREIVYSVANKYGDEVLPASKLTRYDNNTVNVYDYDPAIAVTPDGHMGLIWYQYQYQYNSNTNSSLYNYNIFFAVVSANGQLVYGPINLTNNALWGSYDSENVPEFYAPTIAATGDNHFIYAWQKEVRQGKEDARNIYYGVRNKNGAQIKGVTALTNAPADWSKGFIYPNMTTLADNRALLTMSSYEADDILGVMLDSNGNQVIGLKNMTNDGSSSYDYNADAVQFANGKVLVGWVSASRIRYGLFDGSLNMLAGPTTLYNNAALVGEYFVSVTRGPDNTGVLTWMDDNYDYRPNLYYALVDGAGGSLLTAPTIIESSEAVVPRIISSMNGYGNAEYTWTPPIKADPTLKTKQGTLGASPGGGAAIFADIANYGQSATASLTLTAVLDSKLTYTGDDSGITPVVQNSPVLNSGLAAGQTITWNLPDMSLFDREGFTISVDLAEDAPIGTLYPVTLSLSAADDADTSNNTKTVTVWSSLQAYMPVISNPFD